MATNNLSNIGTSLSTQSPTQLASSTTNPINTSQPSPTNIPTTQPNSTAPTNAPTAGAQPLTQDQLNAIAKQSGYAGTFSGAGLSTKTPAQQTADNIKMGLANAKNSGQPAPSTPGEGMAKVDEMTPATPPPPVISPVEQQLNNDPHFQQLLQDQKDYLDTQNQQQSLTDEYTKLTTDAGIPALNTQLINMKSVMDGTEDDIRNEITKAGGFATNSQVMALTAARNKTMITNYNNLLQTRDNAVSQINTMIGLAKEDRANATQIAGEKLNFDKQVYDYEQKMNDNAKSAYQNIINTPGYGYKGLYDSTGGDPNLISQVENSLGIPSGSLAQMANVPPDIKTQVVKLDNGSSVLINSQTGQTVRNLGGATIGTGANAVSTTDPYVQAHVASILNGNETMAQVPSNLRNAVALSMANAPKDQYSPLAASRFSTASNKIVSNFVDLPAYKLTAGGQVYLGRIAAAMQTPGSISDQDLLDSLTKLNTGGNAITDAQVSLITGGKSLSDWTNVIKNKFSTGGVISNAQREQIQTIAKAIFAKYQKQYQPIYDQATKQLTDAGIPRAFWTIPDLNNLSAQADDKTPPINGATVTLPPNIDSALTKDAVINEGTKTITLPRATWSTFGTNMDIVLEAIKNRGYQLLIK